jgi:integrase
MTGAELPADGLLDLPTDLRPSEFLDPLFADTVEPGHDTRPDHLPFQFTEYARHLHHRLAERAGAVDGLLVGIARHTGGIADDRKGWLFRTSPGHNANILTLQPMNQPAAWLMIRRRAAAAGILARIGNHTFRATGITAYLGNGGALEHAQSMAAHESPRTTKLYDRTRERLTQDEVAQTQH